LEGKKKIGNWRCRIRFEGSAQMRDLHAFANINLTGCVAFRSPAASLRYCHFTNAISWSGYRDQGLA